MLRDPYFLIPVAIILGLGLLIDIASILPEYSRQPQRIAAHIRNAEPGTVEVIHQSQYEKIPAGACSRRRGGPMVFLRAPGMRETHYLMCYISIGYFPTDPVSLEAIPIRYDRATIRAQALNGRVTEDVVSVCEPYLPKIVDGRMEAKWR